jgi:hypothetical protein
LNVEFTGNVRVNRALIKALSTEGRFIGRIRNCENISHSAQDLVEQWNRQHPDDKVKD